MNLEMQSDFVHSILQLRRDWKTAASLIELAKLGGIPLDDRQLRIIANSSDLIISGKFGYKHVEAANPDEVKSFCLAMNSQARQMTERVRRVWTRAFPTTPQLPA